jgi:nitrogen fixation NifU-like protein
MMEELRELYQEVILDHGKHPRNFRQPSNANREAHGHNPMCGDTLTVFLAVDEAGNIEDAAFQGRGCAISMASASMMTEILIGKTAVEAKKLFDGFTAMCTKEGSNMSGDSDVDPDAVERLQVLAGVREFPVRVKCATLAWHTMDTAVTNPKDGENAITTE